MWCCEQCLDGAERIAVLQKTMYGKVVCEMSTVRVPHNFKQAFYFEECEQCAMRSCRIGMWQKINHPQEQAHVETETKEHTTMTWECVGV